MAHNRKRELSVGVSQKLGSAPPSICNGSHGASFDGSFRRGSEAYEKIPYSWNPYLVETFA